MRILPTPDDYLFELEAVNPGQAKRMWKNRIKDSWGNQCAYCGSKEELTLDHVHPKTLGGQDISRNVVCACRECNASKGHEDFVFWYFQQYFFSEERYKSICAWMSSLDATPKASRKYRPRMNVCYGSN